MPLLPPGVDIRDLSTKTNADIIMSQTVGVNNVGDRTSMEGIQNVIGRPFSPGMPLQPRSLEDLSPRQFQYPTGVNTITMPRGEYPGLTPFPSLINLCSLYDVPAIAMAVRIEEMQGLPLQFVAKKKKEQKQYADLCQEVTNFWQQPDGLNSFDSWMGMLLYDMFSIDAATVYLRPDLGGRLYGVEVVDGSTIKPLLDARGRTEAYQQILWGYPMSEYSRPSSDDKEEKFPVYGTDQLMYLPRWARSRLPYGYPPAEWIILRVNMALRKQTFDLSYFTEGNIPEMLVDAPEGMQPEQIKEFEVWFNTLLAGNDAARRRAKFMPWKSNVREMKAMSFSTDLDWWMFRIAAAAYGVPPTEMGFTESANKASSEMQEAVNERRGLRPMTNWLCRNMINPITQRLGRPMNATAYPSISVYGLPTRAVRSAFDNIEAKYIFGQPDDILQLAQADKIYAVDIGAIGKNEVRAMRYGDELDGDAPETPTPPPLPVASGASIDPATNPSSGVAQPPSVPIAPVKQEADKLQKLEDEWTPEKLSKVRSILMKFSS